MTQVVETKRRTLDDDDNDRWRAEHNLAACYSNCGRRLDAVQLLERVVEADGRIKADNDLHVLLSMTDLASCYGDCGWHQEAIQVSLDLVADAKSKLGIEHPFTMKSIYSGI